MLRDIRYATRIIPVLLEHNIISHEEQLNIQEYLNSTGENHATHA